MLALLFTTYLMLWFGKLMLGVCEHERYHVSQNACLVWRRPLSCHGSILFTNWIAFLSHIIFKACDWQADKIFQSNAWYMQYKICQYHIRKKSASTLCFVVVKGECKYATLSKIYNMKAWAKVPHILDLGTNGRQAIKFTFQLPYSQIKHSHHPLVDPVAHLDVVKYLNDCFW